MLPIKLFMGREKSGGIVLILSVTLAMILANSNIAESYFHFFEQEVGFIVNGEPYLNYSLHHWINDGLMAMFFFVVGLELKREFIGGELADIRNTILPIGAAIGGMIVPALIFLSLNIGTPQTMGWGIPMATDIAFALGVVYLLGDKVPASAKLFLTTLAIVDDLGAVLVIAFFYTSELSIASLLFGLGFLAVMFIGNRLGIKSLFFYAALGIGGVWVTFLLSGIHATIAAVLAAFMIPADAKINESVYLKRMKKLTRRFEHEEANEVRTLEEGQVDVLTHIQHDTTIAIRSTRSDIGSALRKTDWYYRSNFLNGKNALGNPSKCHHSSHTVGLRYACLYRLHHVYVHLYPRLHRRAIDDTSKVGYLPRLHLRWNRWVCAAE